jgi:RNA polymerase sigma factor (sigma-70 family)
MRLSSSTPLLRPRSDDQLVAAFRDGHEDAFAEIAERYRDRLVAYAGQMLRSRGQGAAEDVVQDVLIRAYRALRADSRPMALRAWLYRIAHNRCLDELRGDVRTSELDEELVTAAAPETDPVVSFGRRERLRELVADIQDLPPQQRSALVIRELDGLSYAELAEALDTTVPAVKSLLVRARMNLASAAEARAEAEAQSVASARPTSVAIASA